MRHRTSPARAPARVPASVDARVSVPGRAVRAGVLTGLTHLDLGGRAGVEDVTPLVGLTGLTSLSPHRCRSWSHRTSWGHAPD
ncbi:hypothetical protein ACWG5P_09495 [Streptomyces prasinus]